MINPTACHEAGHAVTGLLLDCRVTSVNMHLDGGGVTTVDATPWRGCRVVVAGAIAEKLLLPPGLVEARRPLSGADREHAFERAMAFVLWSESRGIARRLAPVASTETPVIVPVLDARGKAEAVAFVATINEKLRPRREQRARKLVLHAEDSVTALLARNIVVLRVIAVRLSQVGILGEDELLQLFETGKAAQAADDLEWKGKRA